MEGAMELQVLPLRRPFLHKVLDYEDEFFALLMLVLEGHSLRTTDASFAESLNGLRRRAVKIKVLTDNTRLKMGDGIEHSGLKRSQRILSVVFLVVLPYFKSKLHPVYNREREKLNLKSFRTVIYIPAFVAPGCYWVLFFRLHALGIHVCRAIEQELVFDLAVNVSCITFYFECPK